MITLSVICLPITKLLWFGPTIYSITSFSPFLSTLVITLYWTLHKLMGLGWLIISGYETLGIKAIRVLYTPYGRTPELRKANGFTNWVINYFPHVLVESCMEAICPKGLEWRHFKQGSFNLIFGEWPMECSSHVRGDSREFLIVFLEQGQGRFFILHTVSGLPHLKSSLPYHFSASLIVSCFVLPVTSVDAW